MTDRWRTAVSDLVRCLRFYSRLPAPALPWEIEPHAVPDFRTMPRMLPLAGAVIGAVGAAALIGSLALGLGNLVSAVICIATLTLATGAFHEDGLADAADGLGGGATPERRLEIMKDSRIGSYGASALCLALALRIAALAALADRTGWPALAAAVILTGAVSRTAALLLFGLVPPARSTGAAYVVGQPSGTTLGIACAIAAAIAVALASATALPLSGVALGMALAAGVAVGAARIGARLVGGHTGDIGGAAQQLSEIAMLLALLIAVRP
jgi:adenosylcobinamide-GDP ribazoletransferase